MTITEQQHPALAEEIQVVSSGAFCAHEDAEQNDDNHLEGNQVEPQHSNSISKVVKYNVEGWM